MMITTEIGDVCKRAVWAFYKHFGRRPNEVEQKILSDVITLWVVEPSAPSRRLH